MQLMTNYQTMYLLKLVQTQTKNELIMQRTYFIAHISHQETDCETFRQVKLKVIAIFP